MKRFLMGAAALAVGPSAEARDGPTSAAVAELRHVIGQWAVRTDLLNPNGSVARSADGYYDFEWVVRSLIRQS
jgi:hypothetical protein